MLGTVLLCFNVYETFKALKPPKRTSNNAAVMRKRGMKGCMCLWVVWGSWTILETFSDRTLAYLIPLYATIKALLLLFLIVSRARGAEAVYLYFLRPLLKRHLNSFELIFRVLDALFSIVLAVILGPVLLVYTHVFAKLLHVLRPAVVRTQQEEIAPSDGDVRDASEEIPVPASREEALRAAEAVYQRIDEMQDRVRTRRDMQQDAVRIRQQSTNNQIQLRVRRQNMNKQPAAEAPAQLSHTPKHREVLLHMPSDSPPPPAYSQQAPAPVHSQTTVTHSHVYPPLPTMDTLNDSHYIISDASLLSQGFHTLHNIDAQTLDTPGDLDMDVDVIAQARPSQPLQSDYMDVDAPGPSRPRLHRAAIPGNVVVGHHIPDSTAALPRKRGHETQLTSTEVSSNQDDPAVAKKKRRITPEAQVSISTEDRNEMPEGRRLGPPQRVRVAPGQPREEVEFFRMAEANTIPAGRAGKRNARDFSDGVEVISQATKGMKKSATSTDVRQLPQHSVPTGLQIPTNGRGVAPLRRTRSKDDIRQPQQRTKARLVESQPIEERESEEEDPDTVPSEDEGADEFFGRTTRSKSRGRHAGQATTATNGSQGLPPPRGRARAGVGLGRSALGATRGARGRFWTFNHTRLWGSNQTVDQCCTGHFDQHGLDYNNLDSKESVRFQKFSRLLLSPRYMRGSSVKRVQEWLKDERKGCSSQAAEVASHSQANI